MIYSVKKIEFNKYHIFTNGYIHYQGRGLDHNKKILEVFNNTIEFGGLLNESI